MRARILLLWSRPQALLSAGEEEVHSDAQPPGAAHSATDLD